MCDFTCVILPCVLRAMGSCSLLQTVMSPSVHWLNCSFWPLLGALFIHVIEIYKEEENQRCVLQPWCGKPCVWSGDTCAVSASFPNQLLGSHVPLLASLTCKVGPHPRAGLLGELPGQRVHSTAHTGHQRVPGALPHHCRRLAGWLSRLRKTTCRAGLARLVTHLEQNTPLF